MLGPSAPQRPVAAFLPEKSFMWTQARSRLTICFVEDGPGHNQLLLSMPARWNDLIHLWTLCRIYADLIVFMQRQFYSTKRKMFKYADKFNQTVLKQERMLIALIWLKIILTTVRLSLCHWNEQVLYNLQFKY